MIDPSQRPRILVVDDEPVNLNVLVDLLRADFKVIVAKDGAQALNRLGGEDLPDIALLDVMMPGMSGLEVCRRMKSDERTAEVPVIFLTSLNSAREEATCFELGAVDYIHKPFSPAVVKARLRTHLALGQARQELAMQNQTLEALVYERTADLEQTQDVTIRALATLAEMRDNETGAHIMRTSYYVKCLALELRDSGYYVDRLDDSVIENIYKSVPLHDIGKVGIPDAILLKPGRLTPDEFDIMKTHANLGRQALLAAIEDGAAPTEFLRFAIDIAGSHHEKWNGSGYPRGLHGEQIPLAARLMAVADVYDALRSKRPYKPPFSHERALEIIRGDSGTHFDPVIVTAFLRCEAEFQKIADSYAEGTSDRAA